MNYEEWQHVEFVITIGDMQEKFSQSCGLSGWEGFTKDYIVDEVERHHIYHNKNKFEGVLSINYEMYENEYVLEDNILINEIFQKNNGKKFKIEIID